MKFNLPLVLIVILLVIISCGDATREEVTKRYSGGEKKEVVKYEGSGSEEKILERFTYSINGELIKYENLVTDSVQNYIQLNNDLNSPKGLKKYLQGTWVKENLDDDVKTLTFSSDTLKVENIFIDPILGEDTKKDTTVINTVWLINYMTNQEIYLKERVSELYSNFSSIPDTTVIYDQNNPERKLDKKEDWLFTLMPKDSTSFKSKIFDESQFIYSKK